MKLHDRRVKAAFDSAEGVEEAFYIAFGEGNFELMESLYADSNVSCTHPDGSALIGREKVISYWKFILEGIPESNINWKILCSSKHKYVEIHQVLETYVINAFTRETTEVYTTNVFVLQDDGWRLQMQHASQPKVTEIKRTKLLDLLDNNLSDTRVLN